MRIDLEVQAIDIDWPMDIQCSLACPNFVDIDDLYLSQSIRIDTY